MRLEQIDLNLFVVFQAISSEANITRAAHLLGLTQPAVSHSLSRLREIYKDPLFIRRGLRMEATPLARSLDPSIRKALQHLGQTLPLAVQEFHPELTNYNFVIATRDPIESVFIPRLMQIFTQVAPLSQLSSVRMKRKDMEKELASGQVSLALDILLPLSAQIRHQKLMEDSWIVLGRKGHPLLQSKLSFQDYLSARHIVVSSRRSGLAMEDFAFSRMGWKRSVAMRCQHVLVATRSLAATDLLLTLPASFILDAGLEDQLSLATLPVECPVPAVYMYWHEKQHDEPLSQWLRAQVLQCLPGRDQTWDKLSSATESNLPQ